MSNSLDLFTGFGDLSAGSIGSGFQGSGLSGLTPSAALPGLANPLKEGCSVSFGGSLNPSLAQLPFENFLGNSTELGQHDTDSIFALGMSSTSPTATANAEKGVGFDDLTGQPLIGVIDTGFSANNPDIEESRILLGRDRVDGDDNPLLAEGSSDEHGTQVLDIIAATQDNGVGIDGINDDAPLWIGRAVGSGKWAESLVEFVDAAKASGQANAVVNLSFDLIQANPDGSVTTRYELTSQEQSALNYAHQNGVLIVAAVGNEGEMMSALGQASRTFNNIITVGAADGTDRAAYSSYGNGLDLLASESISGSSMTGTSQAAAEVTGAASQVWAANSQLSYRQVIDILKATATDLETPGWDAETGAGLLNLADAISTATVTTPVPHEMPAEVTSPTLTSQMAENTALERPAGWFDDIVDTVGDAADAVGDAVEDAADAVGDAVGDAADAVGDAVEDAADTVGDAVEDVVGTVVDTVSDGIDWVGDRIDWVSDTVADVVADAVVEVVDTVGDGVGTVSDAVADAIEEVVDAVEDAIGEAVDTVGDGAEAVVDAVEDAVEEVVDTVGDGIDWVEDAVSDGIDWVEDAAGAAWEGLEWFVSQSKDKLLDIYERGANWVSELPDRLERLGADFWDGVSSLEPWSADWWESLTEAGTWVDFAEWLGRNLLDTAEVMGIGEVYELITDFIKFNTRPLSNDEVEIAKSVFGESINYDLVRIDELAIIGPLFTDRPYTSFNIINSWGALEDKVLIHELTHVWQYTQDGAIYMPEAIGAQHSDEGYNYGGVSSLQSTMNASQSITSFNREQQAAIVEDYYDKREDNSTTNDIDLPLYAYFVKDVSTLSEDQLA